ncbi:hypothetical protein ACIQAA_23010 [Neobacillus sp. NPDC093182]|uniref:hypothetical protein n=1 Tax=Neobacillus sp. NPDC093182 TaxID=3364297 RepID=UPI0038215AA0
MHFKNLENAEVCSVIFIRDYLQFYFEGEQTTGTLTFYTFPLLQVDGNVYESETVGYRDALCSFINHQVKKFNVNSGQNIILTFDNDNSLEISLKKESLNGQEAAMLRIENQINVW